MKLPEQWPSLVFSMCLLLLVFTVLFVGGWHQGFCSPVEYAAVCAREYASAFATFIVGSVAAVIAYRQYAESRRQSGLAALPEIDRRLRFLAEFESVVLSIAINGDAIGEEGRLAERLLKEGIYRQRDRYTGLFKEDVLDLAENVVSSSLEKFRRLQKDSYLMGREILDLVHISE